MEKKHQYRGLTKQEVEESRRLHGENVLTPAQESFVMEPILGEIRRSYYSYIISGMALVHDNRWRTLLGT